MSFFSLLRTISNGQIIRYLGDSVCKLRRTIDVYANLFEETAFFFTLLSRNGTYFVDESFSFDLGMPLPHCKFTIRFERYMVLLFSYGFVGPLMFEDRDY